MWVRDPEPPGKARRRVKRAQRKEAAAARAAATRRPSDPVVGSPKWVTVDSEAPLPKPSELPLTAGICVAFFLMAAIVVDREEEQGSGGAAAAVGQAADAADAGG